MGRFLRFLTWWLIFSGIYASSSVCPFCGQVGCPVGGASAGLVGGLFALVIGKGKVIMARITQGFLCHPLHHEIHSGGQAVSPSKTRYGASPHETALSRRPAAAGFASRRWKVLPLVLLGWCCLALPAGLARAAAPAGPAPGGRHHCTPGRFLPADRRRPGPGPGPDPPRGQPSRL